MKKSLMATSVATLCLLPLSAMADTTLYGELRHSLNSVDEDRTGGMDGLSGQDNISLFGLKGSYGENIKAFYHLQTQALTDDPNRDTRAFQQRFFMGGLEGDFGKVTYGRMTNAFKFPGFAMDPFYNLSHVSASGTYAIGGATYGLSGATNGFTDNAFQYVTPSLNDVKLTGGFYVDDSNEDDHGYLAGISYNGVKGLDVGGTFASNGTTAATLPGIAAGSDAYRLYGTYKMDPFKVYVSYENVGVNRTADVNYLYIGGTMTLDSTDISLSIGSVGEGAAEGVGVTAGAFYHIAENTQLFGLVSWASLDDTAIVGGQNTDPRVLSLGAMHKFSLRAQ